ncbi:MAG: DUF512 domain-containing protein [Nitrospiria bacterium]
MIVNDEMKSAQKGLLINYVEHGSIAEEIELEPGDELLSINEKSLRDVIDYKFFITEEELIIEVRKKDGEIWEIEIEKEYDEELGLDFIPMRIRQCPNECEFCFVDQMPGGYRQSLYIRDEDYRFSFMYGNYITLTNLSKKDKERIFEQKLSPLYISVHTTDVELRKRLLKNEHAPPILSQIEELTEHGIRLHTQIVLTPGFNDGLYLEKSVSDLAKFYPKVMSLAIVPVGLTRHRENLASLRVFTPEYARETIQKIHQWQSAFKKEFAYPFVYPADEMFIIGETPIPSIEYYEEFPQLENGVGMVAAFLSELDLLAETLPGKLKKKTEISLVTGTSFYPFLKKSLEKLKVQGLTFQIYPVLNDFLGQTVTMTGLMVGRDIISQLKGKNLGDHLLVPSVALNEESHLFLDETPFEALEKELGVSTVMVDPTAAGLFRFIESLAL